MRIYGSRLMDRYCLPILVAAVATQSILFYCGLIGMRYTNPLILTAAVCLILVFKKWDFHSRAINYAATGCLMAYLLHMQPVLVPYIRRFLIAEYTACGYWIYMLEILSLSAVVFLVAVILDKVQSALYQGIIKCL